jgi:tagaturonate reductase
MQDEVITSYISKLAMEEIVTAIESESIGNEEARDFAQSVLYRFSNPYLDHHWKSISAQFALKMKVRCVPLIFKFLAKRNQLPQGMLIGLAAFLVAEGMTNEDMHELLGNQVIWGADLAAIPGLVSHVQQLVDGIKGHQLLKIVKQYTGAI